VFGLNRDEMDGEPCGGNDCEGGSRWASARVAEQMDVSQFAD
jgi:hypothetical protein